MTDYKLFSEYCKAEREDVAARYGGFRCSECIHWYLESWRGEKELLDKDEGPYVRGECRRKAPVPLQSIVNAAAQLAGLIAWAVETIANIEHDDSEHGGLTDYDLETADQFHVYEWPMTEAGDWCGEGKPGRKAMSPENIASLEAMYAEACPPEEEEAAQEDQDKPEKPGPSP